MDGQEVIAGASKSRIRRDVARRVGRLL